MGTQERKALEKQLRRSQILDAARQLLFSSGIDSISISRISDKAELGVGTIYFYFKSKEEIFAALQEEGLDLLYSKILKAVKNDTAPENQLAGIAKVYYRFSEENKNYFDIINYFLSSPRVFFEQELKQKIDMSGHKILKIIRDTVLSGIQGGVFEEPAPGRFAVMFWGTLHGLLHFKKLEHTVLENENHQDLYEYSVNKLIDAIRCR
ncbi:MAG: TetR/AcrR family transcriptional regulator [Desulfobacula sp.]|jgi:AcrR family transcriptional regulator